MVKQTIGQGADTPQIIRQFDKGRPSLRVRSTLTVTSPPAPTFLHAACFTPDNISKLNKDVVLASMMLS